jgi:hypothetical protein
MGKDGINFVVRAEENRPYVVLDKEFLGKPTLSGTAKGLLAYLCSLPPDWRLYKSELYTHFSEGRRTIDNAMRELVANDYMIGWRRYGEGHRMEGITYQVSSAPMSEEQRKNDILKPMQRVSTTRDSIMPENDTVENDDDGKSHVLSINELNLKGGAPQARTSPLVLINNIPQPEKNEEKSEEKREDEDQEEGFALGAQPPQEGEKKEKTIRETGESVKAVIEEYRRQWASLHKRGVLSRPEPLVNYPATVKLVKQALALGYSVEEIKRGVVKGASDSFVLSNGYCLHSVISEKMLARLVNGVALSSPPLEPSKAAPDATKKYGAFTRRVDERIGEGMRRKAALEAELTWQRTHGGDEQDYRWAMLELDALKPKTDDYYRRTPEQQMSDKTLQDRLIREAWEFELAARQPRIEA